LWNSPKDKRDAREDRKKEEKQKVVEELNLMKNLQQKEIVSKLEQLQKIAGKDGEVKMDGDYFEKDFDPDEVPTRIRPIQAGYEIGDSDL
jgi:hypothetical protein